MKLLPVSVALTRQAQFRGTKGLGAVILLVAGFTIAFLSLGGFRAEAATINWTNIASGGWNAATNWNPNSVPGSTDTAIITNAGVTVSLNGNTTVGAVILGTNGPGTVTLSLAGQTLGLNGPLTVNPSGLFTVDSGTLLGNTNAILNGTIGWTAGDLSGILTVASGSTLNITMTANDHDLPNCILTNNGTVAWASGTLRGGNTTVYNNGLWDAQSDEVFNNALSGSNPVFNNFGTFRKSGGASEFTNATVFANVVFNQLAGVIDVQNGTNGLELALQGGGNLNGGFISTNSQGLTVLSLGNYNINGTVTGTNTWEDAGNLVGANMINGALTWVSGNWDGAPAVTIANNSRLIVAGGVGGVNDMDGCILTNNGTVAWASGTIRGGNTTVYNNGLWDAQSDEVFNNALSGSNPVFNNLGTFRKSGGASEFANATVFANVVFNQLAGVIDVQNGTNGLELALQGGGNFTGGFITTNKFGLTTLELFGYTINGTVTGTNTWETDNGSLVGTNIINGELTWVSGNWNGAPAVTIANNSTLIVNGGGGVNDMDNCILTNNGTVAWVSGTIRGGLTTIYNKGLWDAQSDQIVNDALSGGPFLFNNLGTFRKSGTGGGSSQLQNGVTFNNLGTLDVLTGVVSLLGTYNLTNGTLGFTLTSLTNFGQLSVVSSVALGGPLNVNLAGGFAPSIGDQFHVVSSSGLSGTFSSVSVPAGISVTYSNNGVFLDLTGLIPVQIINTKLVGTNLLFQFPTVSGQSYTIQSNDDLTTNNWAFYTNIAGNGSVFQFQTPVMAIPPQNFFRVREP